MFTFLSKISKLRKFTNFKKYNILKDLTYNIYINKMLYQCERCEYKSENKQTMDRHIKRKNMCKPILNNVCPNYIKLKCNECGKNYSSIKKLNIHLKKFHEICDDTSTALLKFADMLNKKDQQIQDQQKIIMELAKKAGITNITNNDNSKTLNITTKNFILPYSDTDMSHITDKMKHEFFNNINDEDDIIDSVTNLIKVVHFNPDKPENHNTYISNLRQNTVVVYDRTSDERLLWEVIERKPFVQKLIDDKSNYIERWGYKQGKNNKNLKNLSDKYHDIRENGDNTENKIERKIDLTLYNGKIMIKESRKMISN